MEVNTILHTLEIFKTKVGMFSVIACKLSTELWPYKIVMAIDSVSYPLNTLRMCAFPPSCAFKGFKHKVIPSGHRLSIDSLSKQGIVF